MAVERVKSNISTFFSRYPPQRTKKKKGRTGWRGADSGGIRLHKYCTRFYVRLPFVVLFLPPPFPPPYNLPPRNFLFYNNDYTYKMLFQNTYTYMYTYAYVERATKRARYAKSAEEIGGGGDTQTDTKRFLINF